MRRHMPTSLPGIRSTLPTRRCLCSPPTHLLPPACLPARLPEQDQQRISGALYALRFLARKYEFRDEEERGPLEAVVNATFPVLLQIFQVGGWLLCFLCGPPQPLLGR
jgi:hypothetical protein